MSRVAPARRAVAVVLVLAGALALPACASDNEEDDVVAVVEGPPPSPTAPVSQHVTAPNLGLGFDVPGTMATIDGNALTSGDQAAIDRYAQATNVTSDKVSKQAGVVDLMAADILFGNLRVISANSKTVSYSGVPPEEITRSAIESTGNVPGQYTVRSSPIGDVAMHAYTPSSPGGASSIMIFVPLSGGRVALVGVACSSLEQAQPLADAVVASLTTS